MPVYEFACCGEDLSTVRSMTADTMTKFCPNCGEQAQRVFSVPGVSIFTEHFSPATGQMVKSQSDFKSQLKRASEEATERTGVPHNYVPVELTKPVEGPGTDEQARKHRDLGTPGWERKKLYL